MVHCPKCSALVQAYKKGWTSHVESARCKTAGADKAFSDKTLLAFQPVATASDKAKLKPLTSACLLAGGMSFNAQSELFSQGAPELYKEEGAAAAGAGAAAAAAATADDDDDDDDDDHHHLDVGLLGKCKKQSVARLQVLRQRCG